MTDIRDARFFVVDEHTRAQIDIEPLELDAAFDKANTLTENGKRIKVLCTEGATQIEITRLATA